MALFPQRIVHKNTTDSDSQLAERLSRNGSDALIPGELLVQRSDGIASLYALDSNGNAVDIANSALKNRTRRFGDLVDVSLEPSNSRPGIRYATKSGDLPSFPGQFRVETAALVLNNTGSEGLDDKGDEDDTNDEIIPAETLPSSLESSARIWIAKNDEDPEPVIYSSWDNISRVEVGYTNRYIRFAISQDDATRLADATSITIYFDNPSYPDVENLSVLVYEEQSSSWVPRNPPPLGGVSGINLKDFGDVDYTAPLDSQYLRWDASDSSWKAVFPLISDCEDVRIDAATTGHVLQHVNGRWQNAKLDYSQLANRPSFLRDLRGQDIGSLRNVTISSPVDGNSLVYRNGDWTNEPAPPADISSNQLGDLSDVTISSTSPARNSRLTWSGTAWVPSVISYSEINGRPTRLSHLTRDLSLSSFTNDLDLNSFANSSGFLTNIEQESLGELSDVELGTLANGDTVVYDGTRWVNRAAPPVAIGNNSIGDLGDVSYRSNTLTVSGVNSINLDSATVPTGQTWGLFAQEEHGITIGAFRDSDNTGSYISAEREKGIEFRASFARFYFSGDARVDTNEVEVRFETGDNTSDDRRGSYLGFKMPSGYTVNQTYTFPLVDGDDGHVLSTDGSGGLSWQPKIGVATLGAIPDVDLGTVQPRDGHVLKFQAASGNWIAGTVSSRLSELGDVSSTTPSTGQALTWTGRQWSPTTISQVNLASSRLRELSDVSSSTPSQGNTLSWNGTQWAPSEGAIKRWVVSNFGAVAFRFQGRGFSGTERNPDLYVVRGETYQFENRTTTHPLRIQSTQTRAGAEYNDGITGNGTANGVLTWTVRMDAPATLYYQGSNHDNLHGVIHVLDESGSGSSESGSSGGAETISELSDVALDDGVLTVETLNRLKLTGDEVTSGQTYALDASTGFGASLIAHTSSGNGSRVALDSNKGVLLSSAFGQTNGTTQAIHLAGNLNRRDNTPELVWWSGNPFGSTYSANKFISLKLPSGLTESKTYTLPLVDGTSGQFLQTNGEGVMSWASSSGLDTSSSIGALADVDVTSSAPVNGQVLQWDELSSKWSPATPATSARPTSTTIGQFVSEAVVTSGGTGIASSLGQFGLLVDVSAVDDCWIVLYPAASYLQADAEREFDDDPEPGSGVLAEAFVTAGTSVLFTPGTNFFNADATPTSAIYIAARTKSGANVNTTITLRGYGQSSYDGISGGTFGSG